MNPRILRDKRGLTGLETAIILIAFVIVAAAFAFTVLNMGVQTSQKSKEVIGTGLAEASSVIELDGSVIAYDEDSDGKPDKIEFYIKTSAGKHPVDLSQNTMAISYTDPHTHVDNIYDGTKATVTQVIGDDDMILEYGEKFKVTVDLTAIYGETGVELTTNEKFSVEVKPSVGSVLTVTRYMPPTIDPVMDLG
ncbi:MAG: archaellin/type IV pilin N-terminal domain-containing protein [Candidatus Hecatellaceae archaeon]